MTTFTLSDKSVVEKDNQANEEDVLTKSLVTDVSGPSNIEQVSDKSQKPEMDELKENQKLKGHKRQRSGISNLLFHVFFQNR